MPEDALQLFQFKRRRDAEHSPAAVETAIRHEDVAVGMESRKIAEGLHGDDGTGNGVLFGNRLLEEDLQGFPGAAAQIGKQFPVVKEVPAENLRDAEDKMPVGDFLEGIRAEPFPELNDPLLMTERAEISALARKGQKIFMAAL